MTPRSVLSSIAVLLSFSVFASSCEVAQQARQRRTPPPTVSAVWQWQRHSGNPVIPADSIPRQRGAHYVGLSDLFVLYHEGKYKMWFGYGGQEPDRKIRVSTGYAESENGVLWKLTAPVFEASGRDWDRTNVETPSVLIDETLPAGHPRKYRLYYGGLDRDLEKASFDKILKKGMLYAIGLAFSPDGKKFTRLPAKESPHNVDGLVLKPNPPSMDRDVWDFIHVADPHVVKKDGRYHMWYTSFGREAKANRTYLAIAYATSDDGIRWTKHGIVLKPELPWEVARPEPNVGRPYVHWTGQRFEMFYDAVNDDDSGDKNFVNGVGFATSNDAKVWKKEPQPVFISNNSKGERYGLHVGGGALWKDGMYHFYYVGADPEKDRYSISLATHKPARR